MESGMEWDGMIPGGCDLANPFGDTVAQPYNTAHRLLIGISRLLPFRVSLSVGMGSEMDNFGFIRFLCSTCLRWWLLFRDGRPGTRFKGGFNVV